MDLNQIVVNIFTYRNLSSPEKQTDQINILVSDIWYVERAFHPAGFNKDTAELDLNILTGYSNNAVTFLV